MNFEGIAEKKLVIFDLDQTIGYLEADWEKYAHEASKYKEQDICYEHRLKNFHAVEQPVNI